MLKLVAFAIVMLVSSVVWPAHGDASSSRSLFVNEEVDDGETLFERQIEWLGEQLHLVQAGVVESQTRFQRSKVEAFPTPNTRALALQQSSAAPCTVTNYDEIVNRMSFCTDPFFKWTGETFEDAKSVNFACKGVCASRLASLTTFEKKCVAYHHPVLSVIFEQMCTTQEEQFCGEPFAVLQLFSTCKQWPHPSLCGLYHGCSWSTSSSRCLPNYKEFYMKRMCTKCLDVLFNAFGAATGSSNAAQIATEKALDTICLNEQGTYCIEKIAADPDLAMAQRYFIDFTTPQLTKICTTDAQTCFMRYHSLNVNWFESNLIDDYEVCVSKNGTSFSCGIIYQREMRRVERTRVMLDNMCTTKENTSATSTSNYCLALPTAARIANGTDFLRCWHYIAEYPEVVAICTERCKQVVVPYVESWGCCAGSLQTMLRTPPAVPLPDSSSSTYTRPSQSDIGSGGIMNLEKVCTPAYNVSHLDLGPSRCKASFATFSVPLNLSLGIAWTKVESHEAVLSQIRYYLVLDLSGRLGIPAEGFSNVTVAAHPSLTVELPSFSGNEITPATRLTFNLRGNSDHATTSARTKFETLKTTSLPLPLTKNYLATGCSSVGGCTDPSSLTLVLQETQATGSGAASGTSYLLPLLLLAAASAIAVHV